MIPKIIHYCWISNDSYPSEILECINSWSRYCPEYEIKLWDYDELIKIHNLPQWIYVALQNKKYAFVADYIRYYSVYTYGGFYFDSDYKLLKEIPDSILNYEFASSIEDTRGFYNGFCEVNGYKFGIGINSAFLGGIQHNKVCKEVLNYYNNEYGKLFSIKELENNLYFPIAPQILAKCCEKFGYTYDNSDLNIFNNIYLDKTLILNKSDYINLNFEKKKEIVGIHLCLGSWRKKASIPKIIHYCWISGEENMPEDIKQCISSWHEHLPDYKFINWNDSNFDWNICEFTKYCREHNLYAFCADYIRFWALYNYGGIYLDCDVFVKETFDPLLKMRRIITKEILYTKNNFFEAAILGCQKEDSFFKEVLEYYNSVAITEKDEITIAPVVIGNVAKKFCNNAISSIEEELSDPHILNILDKDKFFNLQSDCCVAQHCFKGSWWGQFDKINCLATNNLSIYLCAHKPIENQIPSSSLYKILSQSKEVTSVNEVIYLTDNFSINHNVCYSEGTAIRYLYEHKEILPDYVGFGHYRRMFVEFIGREQFIPQIIDAKGAIIKTPFDHSLGSRGTNRGGMYQDHQKDDIDTFIQCVYDVVPEYKEAFDQLLCDKYQYACNCFAMKKEHFLEMCEMCFKVLDEFDKRQGYKNNNDVFIKMVKNSHKYHLKYGINWQSRLQGFLLEWLTELYYRYKFGVENCYKSEAEIPLKE